MGLIISEKNVEIRVNALQDLYNNGWTIEDGKLVHLVCSSGFVKTVGIKLEEGKSYTVEYLVANYTIGDVYISVGGTQGVVRSSNGFFTEEIIAGSSNEITFWSDGSMELSELKIIGDEIAGSTMIFSLKGKKWVGQYAFIPEQFLRFKDRFFGFKDGSMWEHNVSNVRNNFYGVQHVAKIRFVSNLEPSLNKVFFTVKIDGNGAWKLDSVRTNKTPQFPRGMQSVLPDKNFKVIDGKYWGDFFRDMNDPNFANISDPNVRRLKALHEGRILQGNYLDIEMSCDSEEEMKLISVTVFSSKVERNY